MNPARFIFRFFAAPACAWILTLSTPAAEPTPASPLPESRRAHTGSERQRIRYRNSPLIQQAHDQTAAGHYADAETTLEQILANDPDNNTAVLMLLQVTKQLGHRARALTLVNDLLACYPGVATLHLERAYLLQQAGQYHPAAADFQAALRERFDETIATAQLDALQQAGQTDEALRVAETYAARPGVSDPFQHSTRERIMNLHTLRGEAAEAYALARSRFDATGDPRFALAAARSASQLGHLDDATASYQLFLAQTFTPEAALDLHFILRKQYDQQVAAGQTPDQARAILAPSLAHLQRVIEDPDPKLRPAARYELALLHREAGDPETYAALMRALVAEQPEGRFLHEYALYLLAKGQPTEALPLLAQALERSPSDSARYQICLAAAEAHLLLQQPEEAVTWLERGAPFAAPDRRWILNRAMADYQQGQFDKAIARLQPLAGQDDIFHLYIGFAFNNRTPSMPGLALRHFNLVQHPEKLPEAERFIFFSNRAYLNFGHQLDLEAIADADRALAQRTSINLERLRLLALLRHGALPAVRERGTALLRDHKSSSDPADLAALARIQEILGTVALREEKWEEAVGYFEAALAQDDSLAQSRYLCGLARLQVNDRDRAEADLALLVEQPGPLPGTFLGDLGFLRGHLHKYEEGTQNLDQSLALYPYDLEGWQERGYQSMKDHRNQDARDSFARAIQLYDEVIPYIEAEEEARTYRETRTSLKQEYTKLDDVWTLQLYGQRTDLGLDEADQLGNTPVDSTEGALQSQGGLGLGYRPPRIGFRNEKKLDLTLRVLANAEPGHWSPDEDTYQGGVGLTYKPFIRHNYVFSFERLFKIGDKAEDNWLWRNTYGIEAGERPQRGERLWFYRRFYGEASYYLEDPSRWIFFGQGQAGPTFFALDKLMVTLPEALLVGRYQDHDPDGIGTYWYYGAGLSFRLLEGERALTRDRWTVSGYAHYAFGRFATLPEAADRNDFEGWIIGLQVQL